MKTESFSFLELVAGAVFLVAVAVAKAQTVPALVNYQGRLSNPDGSALATADYQLTFKIYDSATNGTGLVWGPQVFDGVSGQGHGSKISVVQGYFNVLLGPVDANGVSLASVFTSSNRFVEITVSNRSPILPRQQILTAPFAFQAGNSAKLAGADWSAVFGTNDPISGKIPTSKLTTNGTILTQQISIVTTNPLEALAVVSPVISAFQGNVGLYDSSPMAAGVGGEINFGGKYDPTTYTEWASIQGAKINSISGEYGGNLQFRTRAYGQDPQMHTRLIIDDQGNVGIGNANPGNLFTLRRALGSDDVVNYQHNLQFQIENGLGLSASRSMGIGLLDNGKGVLQVKEINVGYNDLLLNPINGNVGVGTISPQSKLDVAAGQTSEFLRLTRSDSVSEFLLISGNIEPGFGTGFAFQNRYWNGGGYNVTTPLYLGATGKVGIGTTTPQTKLQVVDSTAAASQDEIIYQAESDPGGTPFRLRMGFRNNQPAIQADRVGVGTHNLLLNPDGGKVGIGTINPTNQLHVIGGATFSSGGGGANQSVVWTPGNSSWSFTSDRNAKDHITPVEPTKILEMLLAVPISEWNYIGYAQRHIGPMAQDFHQQFPLNADDKSLNDADLHGVSLAAIQGLNQKLEAQLKERDAVIESLKAKLARIEALERRLDAVERANTEIMQNK